MDVDQPPRMVVLVVLMVDTDKDESVSQPVSQSMNE